MTKQHFIAFAAEAKTHRQACKRLQAAGSSDAALIESTLARGIEDAVVKVGKQFNPNFDEDRFRKACQP
jgi:hypothetical protein